MPVLTADGKRLGQITEGEADARRLTEAASLALNDRDELVMTNERAGVYWRERDSMSETMQPLGWSGGYPPRSDAQGPGR